MIDLTKITTPFGLLDDETQAALKAHGGPWEYFYGGWDYIYAPSWSLGCTYRVKPAPPKPREAWSYGVHMHDTMADAEKFRADVDATYPDIGYLSRPIIHWREVTE